MTNLVEYHLTELNNAVNGLTKEVHNRALQMVLNKLIERSQQIERLLDNGRSIYLTSTGNSRTRILQKRLNLIIKLCEIYKTTSVIYELQMK